METPTATTTKSRASKTPAAKKKTAAPAKKKTAATKPKAPAKPKAAKSLQQTQCDLVVKTLDFNKGEEVSAINLSDKCSFADFMVVASGRSGRHVAALSDHVVEALRKGGFHVMSVEGKETGDWVLIDAGDVIVHIFRPEIRQFYNIEKMWAIPMASEQA